MTPDISILLLTDETIVFTQKTIITLQTQSFQEFELLLITRLPYRWTESSLPELNDPRIKIRTLTFSSELSEIAAQCDGKYIAILHAGDLCEAEYLERLRESLEENPELDAVCSHFSTSNQTVPLPADQDMLLILSAYYLEISDGAFLLRRDYLTQVWRESGDDWKADVLRNGKIEIRPENLLNTPNGGSRQMPGALRTFPFLSKLQLRCSRWEYYLQLSLTANPYYIIHASKGQYKAWMEKLLAANRQTGYFNHGLFAAFLSLQLHIKLQEKPNKAETSLFPDIFISPEAVNHFNYEKIKQLLAQQQPGNILEFGCGFPTLFIARWMKEHHHKGTFVSIGHDPEWLAVIQAYIEKEELTGQVELRYSPLEKNPRGASATRWFEQSALKQQLPQSVYFDFISVNASSSGILRIENFYRTLPFIYRRLNTGCTIVLNNPENPEIKKAVNLWQEEYGIDFQTEPTISIGKKTNTLPPRTGRAPKLSFCITSKNRIHQIQKTLLRNLEDNKELIGLVDFILVDFGSTDGLKKWVKEQCAEYLGNGLLKYYYTEKLPYWHTSTAKNTAHCLASGEIVVNLDGDNYTGYQGGLFVINQFHENRPIVLHQFSGTYKDGSCGRIAVKQSDFMKIGGYDEQLEAVSYQDIDLLDRLTAIGLTKLHVPHPDYNAAEKNTKEEGTANCASTLTWEKMRVLNHRKSVENLQNGKLVANNQKMIGIQIKINNSDENMMIIP